MTPENFRRKLKKPGTKTLQKYQEDNSRKTSRESTMTDVINWMLVSSDSLLSSLRLHPRNTAIYCHVKRFNFYSLSMQIKKQLNLLMNPTQASYMSN